MENKLSASEALYGFVGWLTTRDQPTIFSSHHNCDVIADLIKAFCKKNKIDSPRDRWIDSLTHPDEEDILYEKE